MTPLFGRVSGRVGAMLLSAVLVGWLVTTTAFGADNAKILSSAASRIASTSQDPGPTLTLSRYEGSPGTYLHVEGGGYSSACDSGYEFFYFDLIWDDDQILDTVVTDQCDGFSADIQVPPDAAKGEHLLVAAFDDESAAATFTVPPEPVLNLIPLGGRPGSLFTVRGDGYSHCNYRCSDGGRLPGVDVIWASTGEVIATAEMSNAGTFSAVDVPVPPTAEPGEHQILVRFGVEKAAKVFIVPPPVTLTLTPAEGPPGMSTPFTVRGSGYSSSDCLEREFPSAEVLWDEVTSLASAPVNGGGFEANVSVPQEEATPGEHLVSGRCGNENASAIFTIPAAPVLTLTPAEGRPDTLLTVRGDGYSHCNYGCPEGARLPGVEVIWATTGEVIATAEMSDAGTFSAVDVPVPATAAPGDHQIIGRFGAENAQATLAVPPPVVPPSPTLALHPGVGSPDSLFEIEGGGYTPCTSGECPPVEFFWGIDNERIGTGTMGSDGGFSAEVRVPRAAVPGYYPVIARFGAESAEATFAVVSPPVLKIDPHEGRIGTLIKIEGSGYGRCAGTCSHVSEVSQPARVTVLWGANNDVLVTTEMLGDGTFSVYATVPPTATPGEHSVVGRFGVESAREFFTVEPPAVSPEILRSTLTPATGRPGDFFRIEGSGYDNCPDRGNRVVNIYDRNVPDSEGFRLALARDVPVSGDGTFSTVVQMPPTAPAGRHEINIQCFGGREYAGTTFTVIDPAAPIPGSPGSPSDPSGAEGVDPLPEFPLDPDDVIPDGESVKRAYLTTQVPVLTDVFNDPTRLLIALLLAFLLVFIIAFPAELFNNTYEKNHEKIDEWFAKWFRWLPRLSPRNQPSWLHLNILGVFAAVLLLMVFVPDPALDYATLAQAIGYLFAIPLVVVVLELSGEFYSRWKGAGSTRPGRYGLHGPQWRILPSALIVAGFLASLSELASLSPPYVYGLIAVYLGADRLMGSLAEAEEKEERGRRVLVGMLFLSAVSAVMWLIWSLLDPAFDRGLNGFGWLVADSFLVTFFLVGLETAVFGLMPLAFLKGQELWRWHRALWATAFLPVVLVFVAVQFAAREIADPTLADMVEAILLFVVFAIISILFWGYFHPTVQSIRRWLSGCIRRWSPRSVHR